MMNHKYSAIQQQQGRAPQIDQIFMSPNQSKDIQSSSTTAMNGNKVRNLFKTSCPRKFAK